MTFEQQPRGNEKASHVDIQEKCFQKRTAGAKALRSKGAREVQGAAWANERVPGDEVSECVSTSDRRKQHTAPMQADAPPAL